MPKTNAPRPIPNADQNTMQTPLASDENVNNSTPENTSDNPWFKEILAYRQAGADEEALAVLLTTELLLRIHTLFDRIDKAFLAQPFLLDLAPTAPANQIRVTGYMSYVGRASKLLQFAIELVGMTRRMRVKPAASQAEKGGSDQTP